MNKEELIDIYQDTLKLCDIKSITTKHTFDNNFEKKYGQYTPNISVENIDSISAGLKYSSLGKTCILNMASYKKPGGGVIRGAMAQEECLFRCTNLGVSISNEYYPLKDNECLYTKDALILKNKDYNKIENYQLVDFITIAAINLNQEDKSFQKERYDAFIKSDGTYETLTKNKIRLMLLLAEQNNIKNIILGAFGCGVFKNNPFVMCEMFLDVLLTENYSTKFEKVVFAIINDHNSVGSNYEIFNEMIHCI